MKKIIENKGDTSSVSASVMEYAERVGKGSVLWPLRTAVSGLSASPDPFTIVSILGKTETVARLDQALNKFNLPI